VREKLGTPIGCVVVGGTVLVAACVNFLMFMNGLDIWGELDLILVVGACLLFARVGVGVAIGIRPVSPVAWAFTGAAAAAAGGIGAALLASCSGASLLEKEEAVTAFGPWLLVGCWLGGLLGGVCGPRLMDPASGRWRRMVLLLGLTGCFVWPTVTAICFSTPPTDAKLLEAYRANKHDFERLSGMGAFFGQGILGPPLGETPDVDRLADELHAKPTYPDEGTVLVMWRWRNSAKGFAYHAGLPSMCVRTLDGKLTKDNRADDGRWYRAVGDGWYLYSE